MWGAGPPSAWLASGGTLTEGFLGEKGAWGQCESVEGGQAEEGEGTPKDRNAGKSTSSSLGAKLVSWLIGVLDHTQVL